MATNAGNTEYRLSTKTIMVHAVGLLFVTSVYRMGWLETVIATDTLYISRVIIAVGVYALIMGTAKLWMFTREIDIAREATRKVRAGGMTALLEFLAVGNSYASEFVTLYHNASAQNRDNVAKAYIMKLERKAASLEHFLELFSILGLFGTVAGMISVFSALDVSALDKSAALAIPGFMIALITTAVGICFTVWFIFISKLIAGGVGQISEILIALPLDGGEDE